ERVLVVDAQDRAVRDHAVLAVVRPAGRDDDHLALGLAQAALLEHQRVVVGEEGAELVGPAGQDGEDVGDEAGLLLDFEDARAHVGGRVLDGGDGKARDGRCVGHDVSSYGPGKAAYAASMAFMRGASWGLASSGLSFSSRISGTIVLRQ